MFQKFFFIIMSTYMMNIMVAKVIVFFKIQKNLQIFFEFPKKNSYIQLIQNGLSRKESGIGYPTFLQPN
jgi:hypothetical protein